LTTDLHWRQQQLAEDKRRQLAIMESTTSSMAITLPRAVARGLSAIVGALVSMRAATGARRTSRRAVAASRMAIVPVIIVVVALVVPAGLPVVAPVPMTRAAPGTVGLVVVVAVPRAAPSLGVLVSMS
jgi:hypothetical protein